MGDEVGRSCGAGSDDIRMSEEVGPREENPPNGGHPVVPQHVGQGDLLAGGATT